MSTGVPGVEAVGSIMRWLDDPRNRSEVSRRDSIYGPSTNASSSLITGPQFGVSHGFFVQVSGIAPYGIACPVGGSNQAQQQRRWLLERVSARQCDVEAVFLDNCHDLLDGHVVAACTVPRLRVVASRAVMGASGEVYRGAKAPARRPTCRGVCRAP